MHKDIMRHFFGKRDLSLIVERKYR